MNTLLQQKQRLSEEIVSARAKLKAVKAEQLQDLKLIQQFKETIERNGQLIQMIDGHLNCQHAPMWRTK